MDVLGIPTVLGAVLKNVDTRTLADVCRLVSHQWNNEACRILRSKITITFSSFEEIDKFKDAFITSIHPTSITFQSFRFASDFFVTAIENCAYWRLSRLQNAVKSFSDLMGTHVHKLEISLHPVYPLEGNTVEKSTVFMFTELVHMIYDYFPYLKHLKILFLIGYTDVPEDFCPQTFLKSYSGEILHDLDSLAVDIVSIQRTPVVPSTDETVDKKCEIMIGSFLRQLLTSSTKVSNISSSNPPTEGSLLFHDFLLNNFQLLSSNLTCINVMFKMSETSLYQFISQSQLRVTRLQLEIDTESVTF